MSGEPFPRDSLIDHLDDLFGWELESVITYEDGLTVWTAAWEIKRSLYIPSVTGFVTVSEMRHKWAMDGKDASFTLYMVTFERDGVPLGNQFISTKNASDIEAIAYARLRKE